MDPLERLFRETAPEGVAIEALLQICGQELIHYARVLTGSAEIAEDAVQDLLVALLQQGPAARKIDAPRAWLFTVLRRKALAYKQRELQPLANRIGASVEADPSARLVLEEALSTLSTTEQEVVLLHSWEGLTFDEIAVVLGVPRGTALSRYHRAIKELKLYFGELTLTSETAVELGAS